MDIISIVTVVRNDCKGLLKTAESIVSQTAYDRLEWVVIDGASTDGSVELIRSYSDKVSYWVSEPDSGIYDAMNKGLARVVGGYVLFLNAGDVLHDRDVLERVLANEAFGRADYLSGQVYYCLRDRIIGLGDAPASPTGRTLFAKSLSHPSTFIRTHRLREGGGYDASYRIAADSKWFFDDIVMRNASYARLDFVISDFDMDGVSSVNPEVTSCEVSRYLSELLPPRIIEDYQRMTRGGTMLERLALRFVERGIRYKFLTLIAALLYLPTSLYNRAGIVLRRLSGRKQNA